MALAYDHATCYFWTGTGNSYRVAVWVAEAARAAGASTLVSPLEGARPDEEIGDGAPSLLGLTFPTHGFITPWHVIRFALALPRRHGTHAMVVASRAGIRVGAVCLPGMEGTAAYLVALLLALKGYRLRCVMGLDVPCSWLAVHWGMLPANCEVILGRAQAKMAHIMGRILTGGTEFRGFICLALGLALLPVSMAYLLVGQLALSKFFFATDRCTGCGQCAAACPRRAIRMVGRRKPRPYWTFYCESCQRCMAYCPERAIEASHALAVLLLLLGGAPFVVALRGEFHTLLGLGQDANRWLVTLVDWWYWLAWVGVVYPVFWLLTRLPVINRLFAVTTLTHYWRRYHEPNTRLRDIAPRKPRPEDGDGG